MLIEVIKQRKTKHNARKLLIFVVVKKQLTL